MVSKFLLVYQKAFKSSFWSFKNESFHLLLIKKVLPSGWNLFFIVCQLVVVNQNEQTHMFRCNSLIDQNQPLSRFIFLLILMNIGIAQSRERDNGIVRPRIRHDITDP